MAEASLYPEVFAAGNACRAWRAEFERLGLTVDVRPRGDLNPHRTAAVTNGDLRADLLLSPWKRRFHLALRDERRVMLQGFAPDLAAAAGAARPWLSGARPGEIAAAWPFLGSVALAEARERGDQVEASWLWLYENHCADPVGARLRAFLALAFHEPRLRVLRPYTSHWALRFTGEHPVVVPTETPDRYVVHTRDGRVHEEADAAGALRIVLAALPSI